jgi:ferredoxin
MKEQRRLRVDPIACVGHGICSELLPELVRLDDWGYPIIDGALIDRSLMPAVDRAIAACPTLALRIEQVRRAAANSR